MLNGELGRIYASNQSWSSSLSGWNRPTTWSAPTSRSNCLTGPDYSTDREWYESRTRYTSGWANDSSYWFQSERAKPTRTDPEDNRQTDPAMPKQVHIKDVGPGTGLEFWSDHGTSRGASSAVSAYHQCPHSHEDPSLMPQEDTEVKQGIHQKEAQLAQY